MGMKVEVVLQVWDEDDETINRWQTSQSTELPLFGMWEIDTEALQAIIPLLFNSSRKKYKKLLEEYAEENEEENE